MKKLLIGLSIMIVIIIVVLFCLISINVIINKVNEKNNYIYATLKINMPLNFEDLDELFEFPMMEYMDKYEIGEITGDGSPMDEFGPYATDIEFDIKEDKLEEFKKMIEDYRFPKGSYIEIDAKKDEQVGDFGDLLGVRLIFNNIDKNKIENIYSELNNELKGIYEYKTIYRYQNITTVYYYGKNLEEIKGKLNKYIDDNSYSNNITVVEMPTMIKELNR